jgi:hypothetical protein
MRTPETTGIMFTASDGFPTVDEIDRSVWGYAMGLSSVDVESLGGWFAVAHNPRDVSYVGDDDAQAMDETNWDAVVASLSVPAEDIPNIYAAMRGPLHVTEQVEEAHAVGIAIVGSVLAIRPDMTTDLDAVYACGLALADYPLLDEDTYCAREHDNALETLRNCWNLSDDEAGDVFSSLFDSHSYCRGSEYRNDDVESALVTTGHRVRCNDCASVIEHADAIPVGIPTDEDTGIICSDCEDARKERADAWLWAACAS